MAITDLRYIDSDGHILEPPTAMPTYAPAEFRDRIWHVETDGKAWSGWCCQRRPDPLEQPRRSPAPPVSPTSRSTPCVGQRCSYSQCRPAAWDARARLGDLDTDIDRPVRPVPDHAARPAGTHRRGVRVAQARAYNEWCSDHVQEGQGRCSGRAPCRRCTTPEGVAAWWPRSAGSRGFPAWCRCSCAPTRPSTGGPSTCSDYDPIWQAPKRPACPSRSIRSSPPTCRAPVRDAPRRLRRRRRPASQP